VPRVSAKVFPQAWHLYRRSINDARANHVPTERLIERTHSVTVDRVLVKNASLFLAL
jgi:hypothetical protein